MEKIGEVTHCFKEISVAAIELSAPLKVGESIKIVGETSNFTQEVGSMQYEHDDIEEAEAGMEVAIKVKERARVGDGVHRLSERD